MRVHHGLVVLGIALTLAPREAPATQPGAPAFEMSARVLAQSEAAGSGARTVLPPLEEDSVRLAVLGDTGTGGTPQFQVGAQLVESRQRFPFEFVLLLGDNLYGRERPQDFAKKFEMPYASLLSAKVPFYASLGNHDDPTQRYYKPFNMNGERFYTFEKGDARFFALDSNYMDRAQLEWLEDELSRSNSRWKIAFFHHPLYSSGGRHGSDEDLRELLEPLLVKYGVDAVFAGHEHFYERIKPQKGVYHFIAGGSAKLARGDIRRTPLTAAAVDTDHTFLLVELGKTSMQYQALTRAGLRMDAGILPLPPDPPRRGNIRSSTE